MAVIVEPKATTKECLDAARTRIEILRTEQLGAAAAARRSAQDPTFGERPATDLDRANRAGREYSLALTALEEAMMRLNRGLTMAAGVYNEVDLEKPDGIERAQANHAANVAGNQAGTPQRS